MIDAVKMSCILKEIRDKEEIDKCPICQNNFKDEINPEKEVYIDLKLQSYI